MQNSQTLKQNERKLRLFTPSFALLDEALIWSELQNKILLLLSLAHSQSEWERHWDSLSGHIGKGSTFSQATSITMYLTYFLLTAFPSSSCCAGEARISSLSSPLLSLLPAQMLEWCNEKDQRADLDGKINLQYFKKEKKKEEKETMEIFLISKADFFGHPMGTPRGRGEGKGWRESEWAKEGAGSWSGSFCWLLSLPPPPCSPALLQAKLLRILPGQTPLATPGWFLSFSDGLH